MGISQTVAQFYLKERIKKEIQELKAKLKKMQEALKNLTEMMKNEM